MSIKKNNHFGNVNNMTEEERKVIEAMQMSLTGKSSSRKQNDQPQVDDENIIIDGKKIKVEPYNLVIDDDEKMLFKKMKKDSESFMISEIESMSRIDSEILNSFKAIFDDIYGAHIFYDPEAKHNKVVLSFIYQPDEIVTKKPGYDPKEDRRAFKSLINIDEIKKKQNNSISRVWLSAQILNRDYILQDSKVSADIISATQKCTLSTHCINALISYLYNKHEYVPGEPKVEPFKTLVHWWCEYQKTPNGYGFGGNVNIVCNVVLDAEKVIKVLCDGKEDPTKYEYQLKYLGQAGNNMDYIMQITRFSRSFVKGYKRDLNLNLVDIPVTLIDPNQSYMINGTFYR